MSISSLDSQESECFICNEKREEPAMNLLDYEINRQCQCNGKLHAQCYLKWLQRSRSCPVCRKPIIIENYIYPMQRSSTIDLLPNYVEIVRPNNYNNIINRAFKYLVTIVIVLSIVAIVIVSLSVNN